MSVLSILLIALAALIIFGGITAGIIVLIVSLTRNR